MLTPDVVRRVLWSPPDLRQPAGLAEAVATQLRDHGARDWQVELVGPVLVDSILHPAPAPDLPPEPSPLTDDLPEAEAPGVG
jgi:ribonuclease D